MCHHTSPTCQFDGIKFIILARTHSLIYNVLRTLNICKMYQHIVDYFNEIREETDEEDKTRN